METNEYCTENLIKTIDELRDENKQLKMQNEWLLSQIRLSKHKGYGASSEKSDICQINIFNEAEEASDLSIPEPSLTEVKAHFRKRTRLITDKLPQDLPIEIIEHKLSEGECICPECGDKLHGMVKRCVRN